MCEICEQYQDRLSELLNLEADYSVDKPGFLLRTMCTANTPCSPDLWIFSFYTCREDLLETVTLLPYLFGSVRNDCDNLAAVRAQVSDVVARYEKGELTTGMAIEAINAELYATDIGIVIMGSIEECCSSREQVFADFRSEAREELEEWEETSRDRTQPFDQREREKLIQWLNYGDGNLGGDFNMAV